jgi:threonine synthase
MTTCPACGKVLAPRYDLTRAARSMTPASLATRPFDMWRYEEILPVQEPSSIPRLGEGGTPLHDVPRLAASLGFDRLWVKDEGLNPTASFKARGLAMAVARAKELGATTVAIPSAGNAASAMAAYAARAGLEAVVAMPHDTPMAMQAECTAYGARLLLVAGLINDAGAVIRTGAAAHGWFDLSTLKEPYRAEGKKTLGLEVAEQLGWRVPDAIVYPTGGGTGIVGMWKAFSELESMGLIGPKRPKMIAVQAEGCAPIVRAFDRGERHAELWANASTSAPGLRVPVAIGDYLILDAVRASGGTAITVTEAELREGMGIAARLEGLFVSPESGAALAGTRKLRSSGLLGAADETVVFSTGAGVKHIDLIDVDAPVIDPRSATLAQDISAALRLD